MQARVQRILMLAAVGFWLEPVAGFGPAGHDVVCDIAQMHLCVRAHARVSELLDGESLARAGRWPDWIRRTPEWKHTAAWHYINVGDNERVADAVDGSQGDVVTATVHHLNRVADEALSVAERGESLRFATHFLADIHQPLHVGRATDRGGNKIAVYLNGKQTNLHALWDGQYLLQSFGLERHGLAHHLAAQIPRHSDAWRRGDPLTWAQESFRLRPVVYGPVRGRRLSLAENGRYLRTARDIVSERLAQAGIRTAAVLNNIFCNES